MAETTEKNPQCPHEPGSVACLNAIWSRENLCLRCPWWDPGDDPFAEEGDEDDE